MTGYQDFVPKQRFQPHRALALAPDTRTVAYSSNTSGQFNLWVQPSTGGPARQLTDYTRQAVREIAWSPDGRTLLYTADHDGDEQYQIHRMPSDGGELALLTPGEGYQRYLAANPFDPTSRLMVYSVNDRDRGVQDTVVRDLSDGAERRFIPPPGVMFEPVGVSPDGRRLLIAGFRSQTDYGSFLVNMATGEMREVVNPAGEGLFEPVGWARDSAGFYVRTTLWGGEFSSIGYVRLADDFVEPVVTADWDVEDFRVADQADVVVWVVNEGGRSVLHLRHDDQSIRMRSLPQGVVTALQLAPDGRTAALQIDAATRPTETAVIDLDDDKLTYLTDNRPPALHTIVPIEPETIAFPSRGGRSVPGYLYRPHGSGPFPLLLWIHGGPMDQERPGYGRIGLFQYLLSQGVGVFCPQVAGSVGYGISWTKLIYRDWGGVDLEDFDSAVRYLHSLGWVDPARIAVAGVSYGGFGALSCLSRLDYPWAAGVSICGASNLITLAAACPPTWRSFVDAVLGNPEADAEQLRERSPVTYAHRITAPLFVIQGAKDPRVPQAESDQIVEKVRANGVDVRYDIYPDEGHGFTSRANEIRAYQDISDFLLNALKP